MIVIDTVDARLLERNEARAYRVELIAARVMETPLPVRFLGAKEPTTVAGA